MADELNGVLKEIATLLHRQVELHEESSARIIQAQEANKKQREEFAAISKKRQDEMDASMAKSRELGPKLREDDRKFKEQLLAALDRQNQALEIIISRLKLP
jgi:hypothetical protein